jgi:hypothetical protein
MRCSTAVLALSLFTAATAVAADFTPNIVKYRDTSLPHATGRSGDATIDALALLGKDGVTDLTVTANGNIDKVQLKADGDSAVNYNNLDGSSFMQRIDGLAPHQPLQVQANVDTGRVGVVTAEEIVKYRPDLQVLDVRAPERVMPGVPFQVSATVREINGDVGARANCVLAANGVEIDRATAIWVDAGGTVNCTFAAALSTMGTQTVTVSAANVDPGDWDDGNNAASASITVAEPFDTYHAATMQANADRHVTNNRGSQHTDSHTYKFYQWTSFSGTSGTVIDLDHLDLHYSESTDGVAIDDASWSDTTWRSRTTGSDFDCWVGLTPRDADDVVMSACVIVSPFNGKLFTAYGVARNSSDATYISQAWDDRFRDANGNPIVVGNTYMHTTSGVQPMTPFGTSVSIVATITDGVTTLQGAPTLPLSPFTREYGRPYMCFPSGCGQDWTTESGVWGFLDRDNAF